MWGTAGGHSYVGKLKLTSERKAFKLQQQQQQQHGNERDLEENRDPMDASCKVYATCFTERSDC
ncbi:MAG: hypothetical protein M3136_08035 [Thermoproteota archaeon]|nr:hypothetical protein [Thermoproteota archaeon]